MIINTIRENFYVDDYLDSAPDEEEIIRKAKNAKVVLAAGDFYLVKWNSNSKRVMESLNEGVQTTRTEGDNWATQTTAKIYWEFGGVRLQIRCISPSLIKATNDSCAVV